MKVLLYTDSTGRGGAEISLGNLAGSVDPGIEVAVAGIDADVVDWVAGHRCGTPVHVVEPGVRSHLALLRRVHPDVLHVSCATPWMGAAALTAAYATAGLRILAVQQLPLRTTALPQWARTRALMLRLDAHVAVGQASALRVEDFYALGRGSVHSVPNGVPDVGLPTRTGPRPRPVIGSLGRLDGQKAFDVLLRATALVDGIEVEIVGEGSDRRELLRLRKELDLVDRVRLPGWSDSARASLGGFDVFALPSRIEGFPLSVVEAMLAGLPVVATPVGAVAEAVTHGSTGLLVPPCDVEALADALRTLRDDPALRQRMGQAGRDRAGRDLTSEAMARAYERLWASALSRPRSPRLRVPRPRD